MRNKIETILEKYVEPLYLNEAVKELDDLYSEELTQVQKADQAVAEKGYAEAFKMLQITTNKLAEVKMQLADSEAARKAAEAENRRLM